MLLCVTASRVPYHFTRGGGGGVRPYFRPVGGRWEGVGKHLARFSYRMVSMVIATDISFGEENWRRGCW